MHENDDRSGVGAVNRFLNMVEKAGNRLPHITMLFIYALVFICLLSFALSFVTFHYRHPNTGETIQVLNMLSGPRLVELLVSSVRNFMNFPPLGMTIVATMGIGIAEGSGFIHVLLKKLLGIIPSRALTPAVIMVSILCHIVSDSAYVVLMPVSALMFYASGRHPLAGIACSFAGLAGGFTASYTPSIIDPVMQSFTQAAARSIDPGYSVNVLCNYFFAVGGTFFVIAACWFITDRIVEPRLKMTMPLDEGLENNPELQLHPVSDIENRAFRRACLAWAVFGLTPGCALLAGKFPVSRSGRQSDQPPGSGHAGHCAAALSVIRCARSGHTVLAAKTFSGSTAVIRSMENVLKMLLSFLVFAFFAAQFLYVFGTSNLGTLLAIAGAEFLKSLAMPSGFTLFGIILLTGFLNIFITSATSKWAILSTIFVPMLMMLGISPELTQAAFRVSDSAVNVSTPLFPFYPLLIMYCQKYAKAAGVGTLCSMMLPYTLALLLVLTVVLYAYWGIGIPLGFDSGYVYPPAH